jgi:hypothetical protein
VPSLPQALFAAPIAQEKNHVVIGESSRQPAG